MTAWPSPVYLEGVYLKWNRRRLKTNLQKGEFLCPHTEVRQPWITTPVLLHRMPDHHTRAIWTPGPNIRECCIEDRGLAVAAWWWEADNRFEDLMQFGLPDDGITQDLLGQLDSIRQILEDKIPRPSKAAIRRYVTYREDLGLKRRRVQNPPSFTELGLAWPCTEEALNKRWQEIVLRQHPDRGGDVVTFQRVLRSYRTARGMVEKLTA